MAMYNPALAAQQQAEQAKQQQIQKQTQQVAQNKIQAGTPPPLLPPANRPQGLSPSQPTQPSNPMGPQPGTPEYYTQGNYIASHSGAKLTPRYNPDYVVNQIKTTNPELLTQLPTGAVPVGFDPHGAKGPTVTYLTAPQWASYQSSVDYYTKAGYPEFAGKYAPLNVAPNKVASIREVSVPIGGHLTQNMPTPAYGTTLEATLKPTDGPSALQQAINAAETRATFMERSNTRQGTSPTGPTIAQITAGLSPEDRTAFRQWQDEKVRATVLTLGTTLVASAIAPVLAPVTIAGVSVPGAVVAAGTGIGVSQAVKTGLTIYGGGDWTKSGLTTPEILQAGATGVIFAGINAGATSVLARYGGNLGAKIAGYTTNPDVAGYANGRLLIPMSKVGAGELPSGAFIGSGEGLAKIVIPTTIRESVGAGAARFGINFATGLGVSSGLEYAATGQFTTESLVRNVLFSAGMAGVAEVAHSGIPRITNTVREQIITKNLGRLSDIAQHYDDALANATPFKPSMGDKLLMRATGLNVVNPSASTLMLPDVPTTDVWATYEKPIAYDIGKAINRTYKTDVGNDFYSAEGLKDTTLGIARLSDSSTMLYGRSVAPENYYPTKPNGGLNYNYSPIGMTGGFNRGAATDKPLSFSKQGENYAETFEYEPTETYPHSPLSFERSAGVPYTSELGFSKSYGKWVTDSGIAPNEESANLAGRIDINKPAAPETVTKPPQMDFYTFDKPLGFSRTTLPEIPHNPLLDEGLASTAYRRVVNQPREQNPWVQENAATAQQTTQTVTKGISEPIITKDFISIGVAAAPVTSPQVQSANPFTAFSGRSYYRTNSRASEEEAAYYDSKPAASPLSSPATFAPPTTRHTARTGYENINAVGNALSSNAETGPRTTHDTRNMFGILPRTAKSVRNDQSYFPSLTRTNSDLATLQYQRDLTDQTTDQNQIIDQIQNPIIAPKQDQPQIPIQDQPQQPDQDNPTDYWGDNPTKTIGGFFTPSGSKYEGFGWSTPSSRKKQGVKSYKFEHPILTGFQLLGKEKSGDEPFF